MKRRDFVKTSSAFITGAAMLGNIPMFAQNATAIGDQFTLPALPYGYKELEPFIDELTMSIHHSKHHNAYVSNLNKALGELNVSGKSIEEICSNVSAYKPAVRNNAGGHYNHSLFWTLMTPSNKRKNEPGDKLLKAINKDLGGLEKMQQDFAKAALSQFGSGWAWLVLNDKGKLEIGATPNQDNPLMDVSPFKGKPILALDVWEHAYYLKHQNKRADYIADWWKVVNWETADKLFIANK